jgi:hypothetical protein
MKLSNSKAKTWRRCPKKYEFKYVLDLESKFKDMGLALGSWMHDLLMHHYDGRSWVERHKELEQEFLLILEEAREDMGNLPSEAARLMKSYVRRYREEDKAFTILDSELDETMTLPNGLEFRFIIDLVVEEKDGGLWLWDHKNLKKFMDPDFMLIDAQLTRYFWCAERIYEREFRGVLFNEIRTKAPTVPALLQSGRLTEKQSQDTDYFTYLRAIKKLGQDPADYADTLRRLRAQPDRFFRRTRLPRDRPVTRQMMQELVMTAREIQRAEKSGSFPRTPEKACTWDCEFLEPCMVQLQGGDIDPIIKHSFRKRDREERNGPTESS